MSKGNKINNNRKRIISILPLKSYKSILIINFNQLDHAREQVKNNFSNSQIETLNLRKQKEDNSDFNEFTLHKSDKKFWKIKNEKLLSLLSKKYDLIIYNNDITEALIKFSSKIEGNLIVGPDNMDNNYLLDILIQPEKNETEYINKIAHQINLLKHD